MTPTSASPVRKGLYHMTRLCKFILLLCFTALYSCGQNNRNSKVNVNVARLSNKIIPLVNYLDNPDSCKKALLFLDSATTIDNSCFLCYYDKLMFLYSLKQYGKAAETVNECIRLNPTGYDLYLTGGILYERVGDTVSAKKYYQKSLTICNSVLETISNNNKDYDMLVGNKAINLIMLGDEVEADKILKTLYDTQQDEEMKKMTLSLMNKTKKELIEQFTDDRYSH